MTSVYVFSVSRVKFEYCSIETLRRLELRLKLTSSLAEILTGLGSTQSASLNHYLRPAKAEISLLNFNFEFSKMSEDSEKIQSDLDNLDVGDLRCMLRRNNLSRDGEKPVLIRRLKTFFGLEKFQASDSESNAMDEEKGMFVIFLDFQFKNLSFKCISTPACLNMYQFFSDFSDKYSLNLNSSPQTYLSSNDADKKRVYPGP